MNDLELCKKFAELEGVYDVIFTEIVKQHIDHKGSIALSGVNITYKPLQSFDDVYNPITDLALTMAAVIKYEVDIDNYNGHVSIASDYTNEPPKASVFYPTIGMPKAIIECILKSEGIL